MALKVQTGVPASPAEWEMGRACGLVVSDSCITTPGPWNNRGVRIKELGQAAQAWAFPEAQFIGSVLRNLKRSGKGEKP